MQDSTAIAERIEDLDVLLTRDWWMEVGMSLLNMGIVLVLAWVVLLVIRRVLRQANRRVESLPTLDPRKQRTETVTNLLYSTVRYVIWAIAGVMVLAEMDINIGPLLASAGIAGLAIGFGAQTLVKDVISGVFLLFDDTVSVGDTITFNNQNATVEAIGVRLIKARRIDGELLMIPAGELRVFGNKSRGFVRAMVDVSAPYDADPEDIMALLNEVAKAWVASNKAVMLEDEPTVLSILSFGESAVNYRVLIKVIPGEQWGVERDLRVRVKKAFDERGIEIPFPQRTLHLKQLPIEAPPKREDDGPTEGWA